MSEKCLLQTIIGAHRTKRALTQFSDNTSHDKCAFAQAYLSLQRPLTDSMDTVEYVDQQRMFRTDYTDAHAEMDLHCP